MLAVVLSNQIERSPLWIIFCRASGDAKSTQLLSTTKIETKKLIFNTVVILSCYNNHFNIRFFYNIFFFLK